MIQPYTPDDLRRGEEVVKRLHGVEGFDAWAEVIAKALAAERDSCYNAIAQADAID